MSNVCYVQGSSSGCFIDCPLEERQHIKLSRPVQNPYRKEVGTDTCLQVRHKFPFSLFIFKEYQQWKWKHAGKNCIQTSKKYEYTQVNSNIYEFLKS